MPRSSLIFARSARKFGKGIFREVLAEELEQHVGAIELQRYCEQGGWPDDESVEFVIDSVTDPGNQIVVRVSVSFEEQVPTSCGAISFPNPVSGSFKIVLDKSDGRADVDYETA